MHEATPATTTAQQCRLGTAGGSHTAPAQQCHLGTTGGLSHGLVPYQLLLPLLLQTPAHKLQHSAANSVSCTEGRSRQRALARHYNTPRTPLLHSFATLSLPNSGAPPAFPSAPFQWHPLRPSQSRCYHTCSSNSRAQTTTPRNRHEAAPLCQPTGERHEATLLGNEPGKTA